ncbi:light-harvesting antenna LH1, alpha subunit [Plastoroseomonas arctica]|uniref:Light-harvesting protein n=1 Tax=Plastoroseomonas arctica TaxID=1509237 RepID=A0AAF1JYA8_9PROT|nr:light-harvesting antenna LH1, alpha subunit [Plastoroseomonas arctica]MBR0654024.1 light-harvesting protein [Plastoroseomonas arctica]
MHKIWMVFDPKRALVLAAIGVILVATVLHFVVMSSPRYCDHWGWCAGPAPTYTPGQPVNRPAVPAR